MTASLAPVNGSSRGARVAPWRLLPSLRQTRPHGPPHPLTPGTFPTARPAVSSGSWTTARPAAARHPDKAW
jgi:hypothetical protein